MLHFIVVEYPLRHRLVLSLVVGADLTEKDLLVALEILLSKMGRELLISLLKNCLYCDQ